MKDEWEPRLHHLSRRLVRKGHTRQSLAQLDQDVVQAQRDMERDINRTYKTLFARLQDTEKPCYWQEQQSYRKVLERLGSLQRQLDALHKRVKLKKPEIEDQTGVWFGTGETD